MTRRTRSFVMSAIGKVVLVLRRFGKLDENELAVAAVLSVQIKYRVSGCTGASEEVEDNILSIPRCGQRRSLLNKRA